MKGGPRAWMVAGLIAVLAGACASGGGQADRLDRNRLTASELDSVDALNLYEVVSRLRPRWLEVRAPRSVFGGGVDLGVVVFLDRTRIGGVEELKRFGPREALWLEYMSGTEAAAKLPGVQQLNVEGAIVIHTRATEGG